MTLDRIILAFAGVVVLLTVGAHFLFGLEWPLYITGLAGLNMLQAAFTGFCPLAILLKRFGVRPGCAFS